MFVGLWDSRRLVRLARPPIDVAVGPPEAHAPQQARDPGGGAPDRPPVGAPTLFDSSLARRCGLAQPPVAEQTGQGYPHQDQEDHGDKGMSPQPGRNPISFWPAHPSYDRARLLTWGAMAGASSAGKSGAGQSCPGCGLSYGAPAVGANGEAVCPSCGAPLGQGPSPDDTAAFRRFYTSSTPHPSGFRALLSRLFGRLFGRG